MSSIEVVKDFCNDPEFNYFRMHDDSKIIDACAIAREKGFIEGYVNSFTNSYAKSHTKFFRKNYRDAYEEGFAIAIQNLNKTKSYEIIAEALNFSEEKVKEYINMKI